MICIVDGDGPRREQGVCCRQQRQAGSAGVVSCACRVLCVGLSVSPDGCPIPVAL
ncbi:hypothetical protein RYR54_003481 [Aeromonas sobria]|nr:hypothetical protein [Aeromonas sobria]